MPIDRFTAALKGIDSVDLPGLDDQPTDPKNCRIETTIRIGPAGDDTGDDFTLFFVTPSWLSDNIHQGEFRVLNYTVVMPEFTWSAAERAVRSMIERVDAGSWEGFVDAFSQTAYWEYSSGAPPT
jgi:hypothetical protein